jgi:hypothetical protein
MIARLRLLAWIAPVLLLAQLALAIHQLEHRALPDAVAPAHECVLCNLASGAMPPPTPLAILPPDLGPAAHAPFAATAYGCARGAAPFLSRAPPPSAVA